MASLLLKACCPGRTGLALGSMFLSLGVDLGPGALAQGTDAAAQDTDALEPASPTVSSSTPEEESPLSQMSAHGELFTVVRGHLATTTEPAYLEAVDNIVLVGSGGAWEVMLEARGVAVGPPTAEQLPPVPLLGVELDPDGTRAALFTLERQSLNYRGPWLELSLGDGYASLGRGAALSMVSSPALDVDTSYLGFRSKVRSNYLTLEGLMGLSHPRVISLRTPNQRRDAGPRDLVEAARLELRPWTSTRLQAWLSAFSYEPKDAGTQGWLPTRALSPDARIIGGAIEAPVLKGQTDLYLEGNVIDYLNRELFESVAPTGWALYGSVSASLGVWTGLLEAKRYHNAEGVNRRAADAGFEYITPPTLELPEAVTRDSAETINSPNILGFHARVDRRFDALSSIASLNFSQFYDFEPLPPTPSKENISHVYTSWEWGPPAGGRVFATAGYRLDFRSIRSHGENHTWHASFDRESWAWRELSSTLHFAIRRFSERKPDATFSFLETDLSASVDFRRAWVATLLWQYTDDPIVLNSPLLGGGPGNLSQHQFGAVQVEWLASARASLQLFAGARRAGLQCAGGQCRFLPAFEGVELKGSLRF